MIRILVTLFAGLFGLAFGSFLNVVATRWPQGESVVRPGSHCRKCERILAWWENVPVLSWLALRGRCRTCGVSIGVRYVLVEALVATLWAFIAYRAFGAAALHGTDSSVIAEAVALMVFCYALAALAALDAEHLWLPDVITIPGICIGLLFKTLVDWGGNDLARLELLRLLFWNNLLAVLAAAAIILVIRLVYWLLRRKEGIGLGDAKLMAMLGAWLGLPGALLAFGIGVVLGACAAVVLLARGRTQSSAWQATKLPLGTFLCAGGIVSALWGTPIIGWYLRWAGF